MEFTLTTTCSREIETPAFAMLCFSDEPPSEETAGGVLKEMYDSGEFTGKANETAVVHRPDGMKAQRLLLVGCGEKAKFTASQMRTAGGVMARALQARSIQQAAIRLKRLTNEPPMLRALVEGLITGGFEPDQYKTEKKNGGKLLERVEISCIEITPELEQALETARIVGEAQNWTRALVNEPGNVLTPRVMAERARAMAAECGLECEILDEPRMRQLGFNTLLGVAQGSAEPPVMIVLRYTPEQAAGADHLALVGKGVTFDTGGISIKPSDGMEKMKYDMAGAAAVLGAMRALARLKPPVRVTALAPCVENMPGSKAQRPGDIVKTFQGKTVEVLNTDAEGRLILADALTYAAREGCTHLVDAATLTGAIAVALGHLYAGAFSNDEAWQQRVLEAAKSAGERIWPFPMDAEYRELLKSAFADIANIGGRWGGSISAAKFLEEFVEGKPWVHLDIAGVAWLEDAKPWMAKGPTGFPVRTLVELARSWAARS
ncbi:MAG: putative cytosol aminopeptidase [Bryobacteraceae bacterium]|nr:MAG: putative cytosol aminopeptidase [Bryobacteraceae bacterium]